MRCTFFSIPAIGGERETDALNRHIASSRVLCVERQFVADGAASFWSICVLTQQADQRPEPRPRSRGIDYKDRLSPEEFVIYARLRDMRKELAATEGVPVHAVFTNEQLAAIATARITSVTGLRAIEGVGEARVDKCGAAVLRLLTAEPRINGAADEA